MISMWKNKNYILLENIRSCYNVGNIIRTADALGRDVVLTWYTPSPFSQPKVKKTSLGAEEAVGILEFLTTKAAIEYFQGAWYFIVAAELTDSAIDLDMFSKQDIRSANRVIILWNEVYGVEKSTLDQVDAIVKIHMSWEKESLNVGQTAAIFMRALRNF